MTGSAAAVREDAIAEDVPCRACGYNLRGLSDGGRCPECAEAIAGSVAAFEMQRASTPLPLESAAPAWVGRVAWGCALMLAGGALNLLVTTVSFAQFAAICRPARLVFLANLVPLSWPDRMGGVYVATVLVATGLWLVASPEPGMVRGKAWRWAIRAGLIVFCLLRGTWMLLYVAGNHPSDKGVVFWCDRVVAAAVTWGGLMVLSELAHRGGRGRLGRVATALAWAIPVGIIAQGTWLHWFEVTTGVVWPAYPDPMFGPVGAVALLPFSYGFWPRADTGLVAWTLLAGLSVASGVVLVGVWRALYRAKKR